MVWKETCAVSERMDFVVAARKGEESFAAICRRFGVSRRIDTSGCRGSKRKGLSGCRIAPELPCIIRKRLRRTWWSVALKCGRRIRPGGR